MHARHPAGILWLFPLLVAAGCESADRPTPNSTAHSTAPSPPVARPRPRPVADPWFQRMTEVGIGFRHVSGTSPEKPFPAANGSGLAALDFDLDGAYDLYFASGTSFPLDGSRGEPRDRFYRNLGEWQFEDVTEPSGLGHTGYSAGIAVGDFDSDGFPDLYVTCYGANVLYRNMGDGSYLPVDSGAGAADAKWATSAAMFDYDRDGLADIYVCNYGKWSLETNRWCGDRARNIRYYCSPNTVEAEVDVLLRNRGDGTFEETTQQAGLAGRRGRAQGVVAADLDGNGTVDLYVGNDLHANSLFLNQGDGRFLDATEASGVAYDYLGSMQAGMGVDAADTNGDGRPELFVTNFESEHNAFYENLGDGLYQEVSQQAGLYAAGLPWVGWGTAFADFDLDGQLDLIVTNGHVDDNRPNIPYASPALLWKNEEGRFALVEPAGAYFQQRWVGRGLVVADLDNDGDQDVVIGHHDGPPGVLRNVFRSQREGRRPSLVVRLVGTRCHRDAVGSVLKLRTGERIQVFHVKAGGSYLSAHDPRAFFAMAAEDVPAELEIHWADGSRSTLDELRRGGFYTVVQPHRPENDPAVIREEIEHE